MGYDVRPLEPMRSGDFVGLLDHAGFGHAPHWASCYCRFYHTDCPQRDWIARTGAQNRAEAIEAIERGEMKGYLAYHGGECVGWLNANESRAYARLWDDLMPVVGERKVGVTICFVVREDHRGKGVARMLLRTAVDGFRAQGFDAAIGLPVDAQAAPEARYRGTIAMYRELNYREMERQGSVVPMWLEL